MRLLMTAVLLFTTAFGSVKAIADQILTLEDLADLDQSELDSLYLNAEAGEIPDGASDGRAMFFPGSLIAEPAAMLAAIAWQGKVFDRQGGVLVNRVFGFNLVKAEVFYGESLFDGKQSIIIDYKDTSLLFRPIRDEIRLIAPNLYLGRAYARTLFGAFNAINFALQFPAQE